MFDVSRLTFNINVDGFSSPALRRISKQNYIAVHRAAQDVIRTQPNAALEELAAAINDIYIQRMLERWAKGDLPLTLAKRQLVSRYWRRCVVTWAKVALVLDMYRHRLVMLSPEMISAAFGAEGLGNFDFGPGAMHGFHIEEAAAPFQLLKELIRLSLPEGPNQRDQARDQAIAAVLDPLTSEHSPERAQFSPARWPAETWMESAAKEAA